MNKLKLAYPLLLQYFDTSEELLLWLHRPNYLFGRFTPVCLILCGDEAPMKWIKTQLELRK